MFEKNNFNVKTYAQGILTTPLAESRILPGFIGIPLVLISSILDPILEKFFSTLRIKKLTWNVIAHARLRE